jgi:hypothetical protein
MKRKSIVIHQKWFDLMINVLSPEQSIEILKLIQAKYNDEEYKSFDTTVNAYWYMMEDIVEAAKDKYDARVEANRRNGLKGGAPVGNNNASKTTETTQNNPNNLKNKNMNMNKNMNKNILPSEDDIVSQSSFDDDCSTNKLSKLNVSQILNY